MTKREALILSLVTRAIKGDMRAAAQTHKLMEAYETADDMPEAKGLTIHVIDTFNDPE